MSEPRTCFMRLRPTRPELLFAKPLGCLSFAGRMTNADEFTAPQETTTTSPVNIVGSPFTSATTPVTSRPDALVCKRRTFASVTIVTFGFCIAGRTAMTSASDFAPNPVTMAELLEILFSQPKQRCAINLRIAAHKITETGADLPAVLIEHHFGRVILE